MITVDKLKEAKRRLQLAQMDEDAEHYILVFTSDQRAWFESMVARDLWRIEWRRQRLERQGKTMPDLAQGTIARFHGITFTDSSRKS